MHPPAKTIENQNNRPSFGKNYRCILNIQHLRYRDLLNALSRPRLTVIRESLNKKNIHDAARRQFVSEYNFDDFIRILERQPQINQTVDFGILDDWCKESPVSLLVTAR